MEKWIDHKGNHFDSIKEMCHYYDLTTQQFRNRFYICKWSLEKCLETPVRKCKSHSYYNEYVDYLGVKYKTLAEMLAKYNISTSLYSYRISHGWSVKDALTTPCKKEMTRCKK